MLVIKSGFVNQQISVASISDQRGTRASVSRVNDFHSFSVIMLIVPLLLLLMMMMIMMMNMTVINADGMETKIAMMMMMLI